MSGTTANGHECETAFGVGPYDGNPPLLSSFLFSVSVMDNGSSKKYLHSLVFGSTYGRGIISISSTSHITSQAAFMLSDQTTSKTREKEFVF